MRVLWIAVLAAIGVQAGPPAPTPPAAPPAAPPALEISIEQQVGGQSVPMPPKHVFNSGDTIRIRVTSHFDGYLYIMDQGTSGRFSTVFPSAAAGTDTQEHRGQSYLIPTTADGWFQISGPAGFDVLYLLLSPSPIAPPSAASFAAPGPVNSLKPRCNDAIFRARGDCIDPLAGAAPLPQGEPLPAPIAPLAGSASRDITITRQKDAVTVTGQANQPAPLIYTFRLAHH